MTNHLIKSWRAFIYQLKVSKKLILVLPLLFAMVAVDVNLNPRFLLADGETVLEKLKRFVPRFAEVTPGVYRSGLLHEEVAPLLKDLGIKTVINLDDNEKRAKKEEEFLKLFGIYMIWIPWSGFNYPKNEVIEKSLALINTPDLQPILVHCQRGSERTGLTIACWRIAQEKWSAKQAYEEMRSYGFRTFWYGHLKKYLFRFARRHGDESAKMRNLVEKFKINLLYFFYRFRKLNPLLFYHSIFSVGKVSRA